MKNLTDIELLEQSEDCTSNPPLHDLDTQRKENMQSLGKALGQLEAKPLPNQLWSNIESEISDQKILSLPVKKQNRWPVVTGGIAAAIFILVLINTNIKQAQMQDQVEALADLIETSNQLQASAAFRASTANQFNGAYQDIQRQIRSIDSALNKAYSENAAAEVKLKLWEQRNRLLKQASEQAGHPVTNNPRVLSM